MNESFFRKPVPAITLAAAAGIAAHKANANAARAIGIPALMFGALLTLLFAALGLGS